MILREKCFSGKNDFSGKNVFRGEMIFRGKHGFSEEKIIFRENGFSKKCFREKMIFDKNMIVREK